MRQTNLKNVACAGVVFIISACSQNTHTHATCAFKHVQKSVQSRHINIKLLYTGANRCHKAKSHRTDDVFDEVVSSLSLSLSLSCHKLSLEALKYADNSFNQCFVLSSPEKKVWFRLCQAMTMNYLSSCVITAVSAPQGLLVIECWPLKLLKHKVNSNTDSSCLQEEKKFFNGHKLLLHRYTKYKSYNVIPTYASWLTQSQTTTSQKWGHWQPQQKMCATIFTK